MNVVSSEAPLPPPRAHARAAAFPQDFFCPPNHQIHSLQAKTGGLRGGLDLTQMWGRSVRACVHTCARVSICVRVCTCARVCLCVRVCTWMCLCVSVCGKERLEGRKFINTAGLQQSECYHLSSGHLEPLSKGDFKNNADTSPAHQRSALPALAWLCANLSKRGCSGPA